MFLILEELNTIIIKTKKYKSGFQTEFKEHKKYLVLYINVLHD